MTTILVTLQDGIPVKDGEPLMDVELRELTVGDLVKAQEASEKVVATPDGYQLLLSPALMGINTLRQQIVRAGEVKGPLSLLMMSKLSPRDLELLNSEAEKLDVAGLSGVTARGRAE